MPKRFLSPDLATLESQIIETLLAGHHEWRPDLSYPEHHVLLAVPKPREGE